MERVITVGPTIHDVARLAGTSKSTVSRYLNGQQVKKQRRKRWIKPSRS
ncbi:LacI family DNA-binding transcriptional regulator [Paenibacillus sp. AR247]